MAFSTATPREPLNRMASPSRARPRTKSPAVSGSSKKYAAPDMPARTASSTMWREAPRIPIGSYVAGRGIDVLIGIRGASRHMVDEAVRAGMSGAAYFFEDPGTAGEFLRSLAREGDAILFKGSRGVAVEKAMERLLAGREA